MVLILPWVRLSSDRLVENEKAVETKWSPSERISNVYTLNISRIVSGVRSPRITRSAEDGDTEDLVFYPVCEYLPPAQITLGQAVSGIQGLVNKKGSLFQPVSLGLIKNCRDWQ